LNININQTLMKKHILIYAVALITFCSIASGCSSQKTAGSSDTTMKDTSKVSTPAPVTDTAKTDTTKRDTSPKP